MERVLVVCAESRALMPGALCWLPSLEIHPPRNAISQRKYDPDAVFPGFEELSGQR